MNVNRNLIRLDAEKLAALGLNELEPYPDEVVHSGRSEHQRWQFSHDELFVGADPEPARRNHRSHCRGRYRQH